MKRMTSRERVMAAANHEAVDRLPVLLWIESHTMVEIARHVARPRKFADRLFFDSLCAVREAMPTENLRSAVSFAAYAAGLDYLIQLGTDIIEIPWSGTPLFLKKIGIENGTLTLTDIYGAQRAIKGLYLEQMKQPIDEPEEMETYNFPDLSGRAFYAGVRMARRKYRNIALAADAPGVQDVSQWFMGMQNLYTWMALYPDKVKDFFNRLLEHSLQIIRGNMKAGADIISILDDYGAQGRLLISKAMWEEFTFPCLKRQCEEVHRLGGKVMLHSCGYVEPLLDKFVEAGVDMLQSFQPAAGNNFAKAKEEFGDKICFMTGIDAQTLPDMSPDEVREHVLQSVRTGAPGGGYVLATNHALQVDTPPENLRVLFTTLKDVRKKRVPVPY